MDDIFKVYDTMVQCGYSDDLCKMANNKEMGPNNLSLYIKHLFNEKERINSQVIYNSQEKTEFITIITNLNIQIINLKQEIEELKT